MFAGEMPGGGRQSIHLPLTPEYLGYADSGLSEAFFSATRPEIELLEDHLFKYHVDFSRLELGRRGRGPLCVPAHESDRQRAHRRGSRAPG